MAFTAQDILTSAGRALTDTAATRWTLTELLDHLNDAVRAVVTAKPNANTATVELTLVPGVLQTLPADYTILARAIRNMVSSGVGGDAIRMVDGIDLMDSFFPGWQSDAALFGTKVLHISYDDADLRRYRVIPGNDGAGRIEAVVGVMPAPLVPTGDPMLITSYAIAVQLPDIYRTPLLDYVLYRAFSKDQGSPASETRAATHLSAFQGALGITTQSQREISAARTPRGGH